MIHRLRVSFALLGFVALVACAGTPTDPARITDVTAEPGSGFVTVRWDVTGAADRFEVSRVVVDDGARVGIFEPIATIVDGAARSFDDVAVELGEAYAYAVAVNGSAPMEDGNGGVRPMPGNQLQVLFGGPVPEGATVRSEPAGIDCATAGAPGCTGAFASILDVTLRVEGLSDATVAWEGCDAASSAGCRVAMEDARAVTVSVGPPSYPLDVTIDAPGMGRVANVNDLGTNPVVNCTDACAYVYPGGLQIGLRADPIAPDDHQFVSWDGACSDATSASCTVTMDDARWVTAVFEVIPPAIESFEANPDRIWDWETTTLAWSVSGGGEVRVSIAPDVGDVTGRSEVEVAPDETTVYTLTATNAGDTVTATVRVNVRSWPFGSSVRGASTP